MLFTLVIGGIDFCILQRAKPRLTSTNVSLPMNVTPKTSFARHIPSVRSQLHRTNFIARSKWERAVLIFENIVMYFFDFSKLINRLNALSRILFLLLYFDILM